MRRLYRNRPETVWRFSKDATARTRDHAARRRRKTRANVEHDGSVPGDAHAAAPAVNARPEQRRRRGAVEGAEGVGEMAVATETDVEGEIGEAVAVGGQLFQRGGEPQPGEMLVE